MRARLRRSSFQHGQNGSARKGKKKPSAQQKARHLMASLIAAGEKKAATSILAKVRKFALRRPSCKAKNLEELATHVRDFATRFRTSGGRPNRFVKIAVCNVLCELEIAIRCVTARCVKTKPLPPLKTCGTGDRGGVSLPPDPCIESIERLAYETEVFRSTFSHYVRCCESHGFIKHGSKELADLELHFSHQHHHQCRWEHQSRCGCHPKGRWRAENKHCIAWWGRRRR